MKSINLIEQGNRRFEIIWKFIRGDLGPTGFEQWACSESALEEQLGESLYLETVSADYASKRAVYEIRKSLEAYAREASNLRCECITLADLADVGMGQTPTSSFERSKRESGGDPPCGG